MNLGVYLFVINVLRGLVNRGCFRVVEAGSFNVNGSVRDWAEHNLCVDYIGVDLSGQRGYVDVIADAHLLPFRDGAFDVVISTEVLEHVRDWRSVVDEIKRVLRVGGLLVVTTRSPGFPLHSYPYDYWRFTLSDFKAIFADMRALRLVEDPEDPGVFFAGVKRGVARTPSVNVLSVWQTLRNRGNLNPGSGITGSIRRMILRLALLLMGYPRFVLGEVLNMWTRGCKVSRGSIACGDSVYYFDKRDLILYLKSLVKSQINYRPRPAAFGVLFLIRRLLDLALRDESPNAARF